MAEATAPVATAPGHPVRRLLADALGPLWVRTFRDPVREGRLRLDGLSPVAGQLVRVGVVAMVLLLASTLAAGAWRRGPLVALDAGASNQFVPTGILAVTAVGLFLAWWLFTWGALAASAAVRLSAAVAYVLVNANFGVPPSFSVGSGSWAVVHAHTILLVGIVVPPVALAVSALTARWPAVDRWAVRVVAGLCLLGAAATFLGLLWVHVVLVRDGRTSVMPSSVGSSMLSVRLLLLPLVYVAAVAVIDFALDVTTSLSEPVARLQRRWVALALVLVLAALKLWFEVGHRLDYWRVLLANQWPALLRTVLCLAFLAGVVALVTRFRRSEETLEAKEDLTFFSALLAASPYAAKTLVLSVGILVALQTGHVGPAQALSHFPDVWLGSWGLLIAAAAAVVGGALLMRRSTGGRGDELGSGMVVVGSWVTVALAISQSGRAPGFAYDALDPAVTLAVLAVLALRGRRLDVRLLVVLGTVLGFSWLVTSRGDYISFAGGLIGLPTVLVVVVGIAWTLLSGSSFAQGSSRRMPRAARPLLFLGYLLLSVVILDWDTAAHSASTDSDSLVGFYFLGLPLAAWFVGRYVVRPAAEAA